MTYIERKPSVPLQRFVRSLWYASTPAVAHRYERVLPSGCAHVILSLSKDFLTNCLNDGSEQTTAPALLVGQRSVYEIIATADLADLTGVLFKPGVLSRLLADRADLLSNQSIALDQVWPGRADALRSRVLEGASPEMRLCILEDWIANDLLAERMHDGLGLHPAVEFAIEEFSRDSKLVSVASVARSAGWSERRFSQVFREQIGFTPKVWSRLQRFRRTVWQLRAGVDVPWAELAVECGFYDQAHLTNEFRSFSGMGLTAYTAMCHPMWENHTRIDS